MPGEGFFRRWARLKSCDTPAPLPEGAPHQPIREAGPLAGQAIELSPLAQDMPHPPVAPPPARSESRPPPTLEDVAMLGPDSDFSAFVTQGVDKAVQRLAMKRLFSDPHFRVRDGLDVYIDDYTRPDPVSAAMLSSLQHAKSALSRAFDDAPQAGDAGPDKIDRPGGTAPGTDNNHGGEAPPPPEGDA